MAETWEDSNVFFGLIQIAVVPSVVLYIGRRSRSIKRNQKAKPNKQNNNMNHPNIQPILYQYTIYSRRDDTAAAVGYGIVQFFKEFLEWPGQKQELHTHPRKVNYV